MDGHPDLLLGVCTNKIVTAHESDLPINTYINITYLYK